MLDFICLYFFVTGFVNDAEPKPFVIVMTFRPIVVSEPTFGSALRNQMSTAVTTSVTPQMHIMEIIRERTYLAFVSWSVPIV